MTARIILGRGARVGGGAASGAKFIGPFPQGWNSQPITTGHLPINCPEKGTSFVRPSTAGRGGDYHPNRLRLWPVSLNS